MEDTPGSSELPHRPVVWDNLDVLETHPELHHYTTFAGLKGITNTNTLWATHFLDLNDASEVTLIRNPLEEALSERFREMIRVRCHQSLRARRAVESQGGLRRTAADSAKQMVAMLYGSTFTDEGVRTIDALKGPTFITSFCTHNDAAEAYERDNGLLSQWRGYGGAGGYCIVFDTKGLFELLEREHAHFTYMNMAIDPVSYLRSDSAISTIFPDVLDACADFFNRALNDTAGLPEDIFSGFIRSATFCKHHAFHEEREVRIALRPATEEWREGIGTAGGWFMPPSKGPTGDRPRRIVLFDTLETVLPIKRVIVGPSANQQASVEAARTALGRDVEIIVSETPYVERHWDAVEDITATDDGVHQVSPAISVESARTGGGGSG